MSKTPRQQKTPKQRAEEALAVAERKVKRLKADRDKHKTALAQAETELQGAVVRRDYLKQDPALAQPATTPATTQEKQ